MKPTRHYPGQAAQIQKTASGFYRQSHCLCYHRPERGWAGTRVPQWVPSVICILRCACSFHVSENLTWGRHLIFPLMTPTVCPECSGNRKDHLDLDMDQVLNSDKSWNESMVELPASIPATGTGSNTHRADCSILIKSGGDYSEEEKNLLYGAYEKGGTQVNKKIEGIYNHLNRLLIKRDLSNSSDRSLLRLKRLVKERECPVCRGKRLNPAALSCRINGYSIDEMCDMEFTRLCTVLQEIKDPRGETIVNTLTASLTRMIEIGLPYLSMNRESTTLSGGEAQRLKLVRYMGSSLTGMTYIFDEPSTGMHPRDVHRMTKLLQSLRNKGNTVLVVEHDKDVILHSR